MQLKLTQKQAEALNTLFIDKVLKEQPANLFDKLVLLLMLRIYKKLRNKLEGRPGNGYSITITDEEAHAYWVYFTQADLCPYPYEANFISAHINQLDRTYA